MISSTSITESFINSRHFQKIIIQLSLSLYFVTILVHFIIILLLYHNLSVFIFSLVCSRKSVVTVCVVCVAIVCVGKSLLEENIVASHRSRYKCAQCGECCQNGSNLAIHMQQNHARETPFECTACAKLFTTSHDLAAHRRLCNTYKCRMCDKAFKSRHQLAGHMNVHAREIAYNCSRFESTFRKFILTLCVFFHCFYIQQLPVSVIGQVDILQRACLSSDNRPFSIILFADH